LTAVSCPSRALCVSARFSGGGSGSGNGANIEVSTNPAAPTPVWAPRFMSVFNNDPVADGPVGRSATSCPSRSLCVADDDDGNVATSTDGGNHWKLTYVEGSDPKDEPTTPAMNDVSCPTTSFCAVADDSGHVITTRHATGGRAWHRVRLPRGHTLGAVSCASRSLCAGIDQRGRVLVSTRPTGPGSTWKVAPVHAHAVDLSCPSSRLCVLITDSGQVVAGQRRG
jgi:hypothetical protein